MTREHTVVVANLSTFIHQIPTGGAELLLASASAVLADGTVTVPPESVAILARETTSATAG
jgi:hypothetical protein